MSRFVKNVAFLLGHPVYESVCRESYDRYFKHKEVIHHATLGIPKGIKECSFYFYCFWHRHFDHK